MRRSPRRHTPCYLTAVDADDRSPALASLINPSCVGFQSLAKQGAYSAQLFFFKERIEGQSCSICWRVKSEFFSQRNNSLTETYLFSQICQPVFLGRFQ
jgi:hypothetical protein